VSSSLLLKIGVLTGKKKMGTPAFIPPDITQSPRLVSLATRIKMTQAPQAAYTAAFVDEVGGDSSKVNMSYSSADRSGRTVSETICKNIKESWTLLNLRPFIRIQT
jgi:hypothetical protein